MEMRTLKILLVTTLLLTLSTPFIASGYETYLHEKLEEAFEAIYNAESMGGDIKGLVKSLNVAISLLERAEEIGNEELRREALILIENVISEAPKVGEEGRISIQNLKIQAGITIVALALLSIIVWRFLPGLFKKKRGVTAAIIVVIVGVAAFVGAKALLPSPISEHFSELGVLGPNLEAGDYPREIVAGENFTLNIYVGNHEGHVMYYKILVKLGCETDENESTHTEVLLAREVILLNGENSTMPVTLKIEEPGLNKRLVFELWSYEPESHEFKYRNVWCQLWVNVTSPA